MLYYFILGQNPKLSTLEIYSYLTKEGINFKIEKFSEEILLVKINKEIEAEKILDSLGGTIKLGQILIETPPNKISPPFIVSQLTTHGLQLTAKISFGFSTYQLNSSKFQLPRHLGLEVKRLLKQKNISSRLVTSREKNLSSVVVAKNRLLKNGAEICFIVDKNKIYLGKTLAVQKFGQYSKFDYGRPGRDPHSGMLPPKVAKMMINLSQMLDVRGQMLDPFCGSGTILQEAALLGYKNLIGSDILPKAIANTEANFQYLISHISYPISPPKLHILDVLNLLSKIKPQSIDAIITEPYLGPPLKGNESKEEIRKIISELANLYLKSFAEFKKVLKPKSKVIIIFPILKGQHSINNNQLAQITKLGFDSGFDLPPQLKSLVTPRKSIVYSRPGQWIEREIFIFTKR